MTAPTTTRPGRRSQRRLGAYAFVAPAALFLLTFAVYPVLRAVWDSFHEVTVTTLLKGTAPFVGFDNYLAVLHDPAFWNSAVVSIEFTLFSVAGQFLAGLGLALLVNQRFPGSRFTRGAAMIPYVIPLVVSGTVFRWMFQQDTGIVNHALQQLGVIQQPVPWLSSPSFALTAVIVANIWVTVPLFMALLLSGLQSIPEATYEAAALDGATGWKRLVHITLPQMKGSVMITLTLGIIFALSAFDVIYIMTKGGPLNATTVLPFYAYAQSFEYFDYARGSAVTVLLCIPLILLSVAYSRSVLRGDQS